MIEKDFQNWYEISLSSTERKRWGHFSTPPFLVEQILDVCGYSAEQDLSRLRVLDPACGGGNFLAGAARRLLLYGQKQGFSERRIRALLRRNIWGFDVDPVSCFLAEMQLARTLEEANVRPSFRWHIHQADALAFPWEDTQNVDLFLANPPYLAAKNTDLSGYRATHRKGQLDSYLLFLELGLRIVRPGGWIGLVVPDALLARANAALHRQQLLQETTIHHIWHLAGVFSAFVGAVVLVAQKCPPAAHHQIAWRRSSWHKTMTLLQEQHTSIDVERDELAECLFSRREMLHGSVSQATLVRQPGAEFRYLLDVSRNTMIERLHSITCTPRKRSHAPLVLLGELVSIRRGEELSKGNERLLAACPEEGEYYPVLRGGVDVRPYAPLQAARWLPRHAISKPLERYLAPKLLVVKSTGSLQATLDLQGHVVLQTLYCVQLKQPESSPDGLDALYYLLALLNSRLLRNYIYVMHSAYKWVQPQLEQHVLRSLPIPWNVGEERDHIIQLAREMQTACGAIGAVVELKEEALYEELEQAIYRLYDATLHGKQTHYIFLPQVQNLIADKGVS